MDKKSELVLPASTSPYEKFGVPTYTNIIIGCLSVSAAIVVSGLGSQPWKDLTNGLPVRGDLGFGKFIIRGITFPFEYPFRLDIRSFAGTLSAWVLYLIHQISQFVIIYRARKGKLDGNIDWTPNSRINKYAYQMLVLNVTFIVLHYIQSHLFYDGLAGSFPEISTLFAGVSSLLVAFMFEFKRRGIAFGWTPESAKESLKGYINIVKEYHGYLASFGIVLTFWYHVMESTFAHATGFFHIFLLLSQSTLLYQEAHRNRYWTALLEVWILVHGSVVAYYQGFLDGALYKMFLGSFLLLFLMSVVWGLPFVVSYLKTGTEEQKKRKYWILIGLLMVPYLCFSLFLFRFQLIYYAMVLALPILYYFFALWYFMYYIAAVYLDKLLVEKLALVKRGDRIWWGLNVTVGTLSIFAVMFLSEFIYRIFVPYGFK